MPHDPEPLGGLIGPVAEWVERARSRAGDAPAAEPARTPGLEEIKAGRAAAFAASVPARFRSARLEHLADAAGGQLDLETWEKLEDWCRYPQGRNLVLLGPIGAGKTYAAVAAARERAMAGSRVEIATAVQLLDRLRPGGDDQAFSRLVTVPVLLVDDLGAERATDWTAERLESVIDTRWAEERPVVATTNRTLGQGGGLIEQVGGRTYSRLVGSGAVVLTIPGQDRRAKVPTPPTPRRTP